MHAHFSHLRLQLVARAAVAAAVIARSAALAGKLVGQLDAGEERAKKPAVEWRPKAAAAPAAKEETADVRASEICMSIDRRDHDPSGRVRALLISLCNHSVSTPASRARRPNHNPELECLVLSCFLSLVRPRLTGLLVRQPVACTHFLPPPPPSRSLVTRRSFRALMDVAESNSSCWPLFGHLL